MPRHVQMIAGPGESDASVHTGYGSLSDFHLNRIEDAILFRPPHCFDNGFGLIQKCIVLYVRIDWHVNRDSIWGLPADSNERRNLRLAEDLANRLRRVRVAGPKNIIKFRQLVEPRLVLGY